MGDYICKYCQDYGCDACAGWCKLDRRWVYPAGCNHEECQKDRKRS